MLGFFRKYQRYFFLVVTVVIIISFSFFGTYSTITNTSTREQIAFVAVDGTQVSRSELDQLVMFISTDSEDKLLFGGMWGPNFLNDGVIKKDFFQTGLAELLAAQYPGEIAQDLMTRHEKEKRYSLYAHPQAQFLSVQTVWNYISPDIKTNFDALRANENPNSPEAITERVRLYLAERKLPAPLLRQVLMYQQKQYSWLPPDPNLERMDLSLFGYHTIEDWFGPRFVRLLAEFIINASIIAEQKGYQVSKADAIADLIHNSEISYKQNLDNPNLGVASGNEYFTEQLHRMQLDQNNAAAIWTKVMLFRRLFHDVGNAVFVDPLMFQKYNDYAMETVEGELYRLPPDLRLGNYRDLQKFEIYLNAISKRPEDEKSLLTLPSKFYTVAEVAKNNPELVQKRYLLEVAQYDKNTLQTKVGVKETWNWEVEDKNWSALQKEFPELGNKKAVSRDERFAALDSLDDKSRAKVDSFARKAIVENHPEWLDTALQEADAKRLTLGLHLKGGKTPFAGLRKNEELMRLLDKAPLGVQDISLSKFSADGNIYYRITVVDRSSEQEILTFGDAQKDGVLDELLDKQLEAYYQQVRDSHPKEFQQDDKSWKPYAEVKDQVADLYFAKILKAIRNDYAAAIAPAKVPDPMLSDISASLRFYSYMREFQAKARKDPKAAEPYLQLTEVVAGADKLPPRYGLADQWKLEKIAYQSERGNEGGDVDLTEVFALAPNSWSKVHTPANGDLNVFYLVAKGNDAAPESLGERVSTAHRLLSDDAQRVLMQHVLHEIKEKKAISLDYLDQSPEMQG